MALQVADAALLPGGGGTEKCDRLLDLGHGATLVRLDPGSAVLSDGELRAQVERLTICPFRR